MKFLIVIGVLGIAWFLFTNYGPGQEAVTDPYYGEVRIKNTEEGISLVGFGLMNSLSDCRTRSALVWAETFSEVGDVTVDTECKKELPPKYQRVFANEPISATYVVLEKGQRGERDGRFVIYGVPASVVAQQCSKLVQIAKRKYKGKVYCIQGTVG